jgi:hypothetical protein
MMVAAAKCHGQANPGTYAVKKTLAAPLTLKGYFARCQTRRSANHRATFLFYAQRRPYARSP